MGRSRKGKNKAAIKTANPENGTEKEKTSNQGLNCCPICNVPADQRCSGCRKVFYCGREHQREHWSHHKALCKASTLIESHSTEMGRYLAACRDIHPGELILEEKPLLTCPPPSTPPLCLACYKELRADDYIDCPKCGWPLCSEQCAENPRDHSLECALTSANRPEKIRIRNFGIPHPSFQAIGALRCLGLAESAPRKWRALTELESHYEARAGSAREQQERFAVAQFARRTLPGLADKHSEDDILRLCGILHINGHELPLREPSLVTVYERASLLAHSCRANCCKSFSSEGAVRIRAARFIKSGEPITICYTDSLWSTSSRRAHLFETKLFWCRCERCVDPSECGTDFSALRCERCGEAGVCSKLDAGEHDDWHCRHCKATMPVTFALSLLENIRTEFDNVDKSDVSACQRFLKRWGGETPERTEGSKTALSPDHHFLTDVRLALAQLYGVGSPDALPSLNAIELTHKIVLCRRLVKLAGKLIPAEHRLRGLVLFELHAALAEDARRNGAEEPNIARDILQESKEHLEETIELLRYEPPELPEGQVLLQAKRNLRAMTCLLQSAANGTSGTPKGTKVLLL